MDVEEEDFLLEAVFGSAIQLSSTANKIQDAGMGYKFCSLMDRATFEGLLEA